MKHLKRLKRRHKKTLSERGLDPSKFYITKDTPEVTVYVDRQGKKLEIPKER